MTAPSAKRYLSVWLDRLSTDRIRSVAPDDAPSRLQAEGEQVSRRTSALTYESGARSDAKPFPDQVRGRLCAERALVVVAPIKSALRLTAVNGAAASLGLKPGMALADARAMHPRLKVADADPLADRRLIEAIADWCDRYTPLVGLQPPDGLVLDISGCAHLFGGEAALCCDLVRGLKRRGFQVRAAIADTVGCAWGVARYGDEASAVPLIGLDAQLAPTSPRVRGEVEKAGSICPNDSFIVPRGVTREALAPLPVAALRLAPAIVTLLGQVGLKRIADVLDRPRAALAARFGSELILRLDQALGADEESITPRRPLPRYVAEQRFADPIALERDVLGTIQRLGDRLERTLEQRGEGARLVEVGLFRVDGKVLRLAAATSRPIRDPALVRRLFAERLAALGDEHDPGFGFDLIRLSVIVAEPLAPVQTSFGTPDQGEDLSHLIDRLGARVGFRCVLRVVPHDTHIPEFAAIEVQADGRGQRTDEYPSSVICPPSSVLRPIKLFARAEPIEAVAEVPDGPPVRFRWRHVLHEVAVAEGPERLAMEWWRDETGSPLTRDYFRIESREGVRFWLYREGLYERETAQPRWFLHGLFA